MSLFPLEQACPHLATPQERDRDRDYQACNADPGAPCRWARRYDGVPDPTFHAERLERAWNAQGSPVAGSKDIREEALASGLV